MNPPLEELADLYVLDRLDAAERAAFETRLVHDARLAALVRELESALARHIHALPQHEPPADLLARIETQLDEQPAQQPAATTPVTGLPWAAIARWGIAAVIAASLATIAIQKMRPAPAATGQPVVLIVGLDSHRSTFAELPLTGSAPDADARFIQLASLAEKYWDKPTELPVASAAGDQGGRGYALFDPGSNQGFIAIQQLPATEPSRRYQLWILDTASGQVREAGVVPLNGAGRGLYFFSVAPAAKATSGRLNFFVTSEEASEPEATQPHGKVVLGEKSI
jgi:anti-sigma-K factor RskA